MRKNYCIATLLIWSVLSSVTLADALPATFRNPPEETKPWCYWYWLNGDITAEGITKDLEKMAEIGIARAMIGNVNVGMKTDNGSGNEKPVKVLSPEWRELKMHALREAKRVGVRIYFFNCPGWSQSGGPWVKPEQSMRRVTWKAFESKGGPFSQHVRASGVPEGGSQDIAVLAIPCREEVSIVGVAASAGGGDVLLPARSKWIWHPAENGEAGVPASTTRHFKYEFQADPAKLGAATIRLTADNAYALSVNGKEVRRDDDWKSVESIPIQSYLKKGANTVAIAVTNADEGPAGLIAAVQLTDKAGGVQTFVSDKSWLSSTGAPDKWVAAREMGGVGMSPWRLMESGPKASGGVLRFTHTEPFTARSLEVSGKAKGRLYALRDGTRELVAEINAGGGKPKTDFLADGADTFSFEGVTAQQFEFEPAAACKVVLNSAPKVAQVLQKQLGRMHPTPSPTWDSYIFEDTVEPNDPALLVRQKEILNLSEALDVNGNLTCTLPDGNWRILYFGLVTTGKENHPVSPEASGLEVDKMSREHTQHHFDSYIGSLLKQMTPEEREAFKGITIDSYEVGAQNWTDGFAAEFERRNGYNPIPLLPVLTGEVVDSAKTSDRFLWDLRRTVADMIAENYLGGLREAANAHGLVLWCEPYGHWGFPGDFTIYGGYADQVGGEFWSKGNLGDIECRAASSVAHTYGKRRTYAEAFTSGLDLKDHPYSVKARGERMFCDGINHFVLHVYAHQPRDGGMPGKNPWFGTAFHRNTPWFNEAQSWVKYLQRCHTMLQWGDPAADVAVYIGDFAPQMTGPPNPVPNGYDFDYVGSDAILRKLDVIDGEWVTYDEDNPERVSARWKVLAIPGTLKHIRPHIQKRIEALAEKGGKIIRSVPVRADQLAALGIAPAVSESSCSIRWIERKLEDKRLFFLSNFKKTGAFEVSLRVKGKQPELLNPVTGEIKKIARYRETPHGTKILIDVKDTADSFFVLFRDSPSRPSVIDASAPVTELDLTFNNADELVAESGKAGRYVLTMSDGTRRDAVIEQGSQVHPIKGPWRTEKLDEKGYSVLKEAEFELPKGFGAGQRVLLDLGRVEVMAKVTLNGKAYDTLWMPPFELDVSDALQAGKNTLKVQVTSTSAGQPKLGDVVQLRTLTRSLVDEGTAHGNKTPNL